MIATVQPLLGKTDIKCHEDNIIDVLCINVDKNMIASVQPLIGKKGYEMP